MIYLINLIVFALMVVCSGNTGNIPINQHKCNVQGISLECNFTVPDVDFYRPFLQLNLAFSGRPLSKLTRKKCQI